MKNKMTLKAICFLSVCIVVSLTAASGKSLVEFDPIEDPIIKTHGLFERSQVKSKTPLEVIAEAQGLHGTLIKYSLDKNESQILLQKFIKERVIPLWKASTHQEIPLRWKSYVAAHN